MFFAVGSVCLPFPITFVALILAFFLLIFNKNDLKDIVKVKTNLIICAFGLLITIVPIFYKRPLSVIAGAGVLIGIILFLFLRLHMTEMLYKNIMTVCCLTSIVSFLIAIIQKILKGPGFRATAGLFNANYYGTICEFIIIFSVFGIVASKQFRGFYSFTLLINVAGIFLCDCQSAWIAVMVAIFILLFLVGKRKVAMFFLACAFIALVVGIFTPGLLPRLEYMPQTYSTRRNIWETAVKGFLAHPILGQGVLTYMFSHELYDGYKTYHSHSIYLDPLMSYGIVGTVMVVWYCVLQIKLLLSNRVKEVISVVFAAGAAALIHGVTDNTLLWIQTGFLMLFVLSGVTIKNNDKKHLTD